MMDRPVEKHGYLVKEGGSTVKNWRKRWFVLKGNALHYMKSPEDPSPLGTIDLEEILIVEPTNEKPSQTFVFMLKGQDNARIWYLSAASQEEMKSWMEAITKSMKANGPEKHTSISETYASVECFANKGIRISGNIPPQLLATISHGVPAEKKKIDERGWYCEKHIPLCSALNLFTAYGWHLETTYESLEVVPNEKDPQVVNIALFSRKIFRTPPTIAPKPKTKKTLPILPPKPSIPTTESRPETQPTDTPTEVEPPSPQLPQRKSMFGPGALLTNDDEMVSLMKEMGLEDLI